MRINNQGPLIFSIPPDMSFILASQLNAKDLLVCSQVSKKMKE